MKRYLLAALSLALAITLAACGAYAAGGTSEPAGTPDSSSSAVLADGSQTESVTDHDHQPFQAENIVPHDAVGYCGNTITEVYDGSQAARDDWKASFWGSDSVNLTDLLLYLDYQEGICRCPVEYCVKTEFSEEPYGINLTEGYARFGDSQVDLTQEQIELIRDILDRNLPGPQRDRLT